MWKRHQHTRRTVVIKVFCLPEDEQATSVHESLLFIFLFRTMSFTHIISESTTAGRTFMKKSTTSAICASIS